MAKTNTDTTADPQDTNSVPDTDTADTTERDALVAQIDLLTGQLSDAVERRDDLNKQVIALAAKLDTPPDPVSMDLSADEAEGYRIANRHLVEAKVYSFCPDETRNINAFLTKLLVLFGEPAKA